jgi:hypothetical protein
MPNQFQIKPPYQQLTDRELLDDLRRVAKLVGKDTVTKSDYERHGQHGRGTLARRFGGWLVALKRAGLSAERPKPATEQELLSDLQGVAQRLRKTCVTLAEYRAHGKFSERPFYDRFGNWTTALRRAGLSDSPNYHARLPDEAYFRNLERLWSTLGRQPRYGEIEKPLSGISAGAYEQRFGSWRKALEAFAKYVNDGMTAPSAEPAPFERSSPDRSPPNRNRPARRTQRAPSHRLRFLVMRRDRFRCVLCGRSPANVPTLTLHVDHVRPWERGGETVLDNLQTLCDACNYGKSNLPL